MGSLKIKFHPLFAIYVFLCIYFGWFNNISYYVIVVTLHEFGHYALIKHYGYNVDSLVFSLSGAGIRGNNNFKERHEILISIAGPLVNLALIIITIALWWIFPLSYLYTQDFLIANIVVMIFNLIPIYPLDGGRILSAFLIKKGVKRSKILKFNQVLCIVLGIILIVLFIVSVFYGINYNLIIMSIFLIMNAFSYDKNTYFDKISCLNKCRDKPLEVKVFKVNTSDKSLLIKYLNPHYYSIFEVQESGKSKVIEEKELLGD